MIALTIGLAVITPVAWAQPDPREIHERVVEHLKTVRDALVPAPAIKFVETFPPVAKVREKILFAGNAGQQEPFEVPVPPPGEPEPPIDPSGIVNFAQDFAFSATQRALDGLFPRGGSGPRKPVIVGDDVKNVPMLEEDLAVMSRILEKTAGAKADGPATAAGIEIFSLNRPGSPRAFYLEGYGAMFVLNVKYPLVAPPKKDDQSRTNETNSEWEKAREEVYGRRGAIEDIVKFNTAAGEEFDSQRVENLKAQLIDDLANAKNIRNLKGDDYVTVVVLGGGERSTMVRHAGVPGRSSRGGRGGGGAAAGGARVEAWSSSVETGAQSTMTLRAKKSDIDAFAKGKLDGDEFRKKVAAQTY